MDAPVSAYCFLTLIQLFDISWTLLLLTRILIYLDGEKDNTDDEDKHLYSVSVTLPDDNDEIDDDEVKTLMVVMTPSLARGKRALLSPAWELPPWLQLGANITA